MRNGLDRSYQMVAHIFSKKLSKVKIIVMCCLCVIFIIITSNTDSPPSPNRCGNDPFRTGPCFNDSRTHPHPYLIVEPQLCNRTKVDVFLVILVISSPNEFEQRQTIRETWSSIASRDSDVRLAFILGVRRNVSQGRIREESRRHHDIVQKDFIDVYTNGSIKLEALLHFASVYCSNAKYILKSDSDMFINVPYLLEILHMYQKSNPVFGLVMGHVWSGAFPVQDKTFKYYQPAQDFPLEKYPDYLSGASYVISGHLTASLFWAALNTKFFWLEDVFITGICRERLGLRLINHVGFHYLKLPVDICSFTNIVAAHGFTPKEIEVMWYEKVNHKVCVSNG